MEPKINILTQEFAGWRRDLIWQNLTYGRGWELPLPKVTEKHTEQA